MLKKLHICRCVSVGLVVCLFVFVWLGSCSVRDKRLRGEGLGELSEQSTMSAIDGSRSSLLPNNSSKQQQRRQNAITGGQFGHEEEAMTSRGEPPPPEAQPLMKRPNVLFLLCDDLNDFVETLGGHPQAITPNIRRLMETSVSFAQAHSNIPVCKESRTSFLSGLYPHTSKFVSARSLPKPDSFVGLRHQRTLIEHFNENGYVTLGTGKIYHGYKESFWQHVGHKTDYGPFAYDTSLANDMGANDPTIKSMAHPDVPPPFRDNGPVDGSFGPLEELEGGLAWRTGSAFHGGFREIKFYNETHRDMTADEQSAAWAIEQLREMDGAPIQGDDKPFFLGVGLVRPHTPMVVPKKYYDMYDLKTLQFPPSLLQNDVNDTFRNTLEHKGNGGRLYDELVESYSFRKTGLRRYIQAYLASVTAADQLIGKVLNALDETRFKDNTIVVFTSDHGYQVGQKDYLAKNLLWQASTRVPLVVRVPGMTTTTAPRTSDQPVTLVDLYPTLVDLCGLSKDTSKNDLSRPLDGHSLRPLLSLESDGSSSSWDGPRFALSAISYDWDQSDPIGMSLTTRYDRWRYIRYVNGEEELYDTLNDPYEWTNLAASDDDATINTLLDEFRAELFQFVESESDVLQDGEADIFNNLRM